MHGRRVPYLLIAPAAIVLLLVVLYPFGYNVVISFSNMSMRHFRDWSFIGLGQYGKVFSDPGFYGLLWKTVLWTLVNLVAHVSLGIALAMVLNQDLKGRWLFRTLLILPWAVPQYITALTWRGLFHPEFGDINLVLTQWFHLPAINWWKTLTGSFTACAVTNIWLGVPFIMIVALGGLQSIPRQLWEAADVDGASRVRKFFHITLPLLKPVLVPAVVLGTIWTFNNLNVIWLVTNGGEPADQMHILVSFVYRSAFFLYRYGYAAALSMVIFLILLALGVVLLRQGRASESGAV
ncbi:MAG: sugar ABC transporter permease [Candidatus Eisenbacteria sp.]|nr:sugar ABC transporter permease [Candidatus Eisenbacteria bacterium]